MRDYKFKTKPFDHQQKAWDDSWSADYYALFMEMGTGKSKVAIDTIGALYKAREISAALILAPKVCMTTGSRARYLRTCRMT